MNYYQKKMAQVLRAQAAISTMCAEVWSLIEMEDTDFGDGTISSDNLNDLFTRGIEINTVISDAVLVAHIG